MAVSIESLAVTACNKRYRSMVLQTSQTLIGILMASVKAPALLYLMEYKKS